MLVLLNGRTGVMVLELLEGGGVERNVRHSDGGFGARLWHRWRRRRCGCEIGVGLVGVGQLLVLLLLLQLLPVDSFHFEEELEALFFLRMKHTIS